MPARGHPNETSTKNTHAHFLAAHLTCLAVPPTWGCPAFVPVHMPALALFRLTPSRPIYAHSCLHSNSTLRELHATMSHPALTRAPSAPPALFTCTSRSWQAELRNAPPPFPALPPAPPPPPPSAAEPCLCTSRHLTFVLTSCKRPELRSTRTSVHARRRGRVLLQPFSLRPWG